MPHDTTLRAATDEDAPRVADVLIASRRAFQPFAPSVHSNADVRQWVRDTLIPTGGVTVACAAYHVVGVIATARDPEASWIHQMFVAPGHTGSGIGTRLLNHALATLPRPVRLYTFQANTRARAFYERHGFTAIAWGDGSGNEERCPDVLYELAAHRMRAIRAPGLLLEPQVAAHAREMFTVLSDPAIYEFENAPPISEASLAARYTKLETRMSPDGAQTWLNWVIRLPDGHLAGYVQATVLGDGSAMVAYELNSKYWRQGIGSAAVAAVLAELRTHYAVALFAAVLKERNHRSVGLLGSLGFGPASPEQAARFGGEADEAVMIRPAAPTWE
jgi:RimJ/RimL family protein N-acetyltransferase